MFATLSIKSIEFFSIFFIFLNGLYDIQLFIKLLKTLLFIKTYYANCIRLKKETFLTSNEPMDQSIQIYLGKNSKTSSLMITDLTMCKNFMKIVKVFFLLLQLLLNI